MELHLSKVSAWVERWSHLVAPAATVLDVACGSGRHVRWFTGRGARVTALDRNAADLAALQGVAAETVACDIEADAWPLAGRRFDVVLVTNYLHRPLMPTLIEAIALGGLLIYETFGAGQAGIGKPSNPAFLLQPGELLSLTEPLRPISYEDGIEFLAGGGRRYVQRIVSLAALPGSNEDSCGLARALSAEPGRSNG